MDVVHKMVNTNIIKTKDYVAANTIPMDGRSFFINTNSPWFVSLEEKSKHEGSYLHTHSKLRQRYIIKYLPFLIKMEKYMIVPNVKFLKTMTQNPICYVIIDTKHL